MHSFEEIFWKFLKQINKTIHKHLQNMLNTMMSWSKNTISYLSMIEKAFFFSTSIPSNLIFVIWLQSEQEHKKIKLPNKQGEIAAVIEWRKKLGKESASRAKMEDMRQGGD